MKRIDVALERMQKDIIRTRCPSIYKLGCGQDTETTVINEGMAVGCRGITCVVCWNKEID